MAKYFSSFSLLDIELETGRTHQIRVHCQFSGHPIVGDEKYGDSEINSQAKRSGCGRLFLHASGLRFRHPVSNTIVDIKAPLPAELEQLLLTSALVS